MSLGRAAASGVLWSGLATVAILGLRLISLAVVARYVTPAELGLASMLLAMFAIAQGFGDLGLAPAIVRSSMDREQLSSLFWLAQALGVVLAGLVALAEPAIVAFYGEPLLSGIVGWLGLRFALAPLGVPFLATLQRDLDFRRSFVIQAGGAAVGAAVTIASAARGGGVAALVAGELAATAAQSGLALVMGWRVWRPRWGFRWAHVEGPLRMGMHQVGERVFNLVATNVDYLLVGRLLGARALGVYAMAFELVSLPARLNGIVTRVAFPVLTRRAGDEAAFREGFAWVLRIVATVQLPLVVTIAVMAPLLVPAFLGPGWDAAVELVQILSVFGAIRVLGNPSGPAFLARGRTDLGFRVNVAMAAASIAVFATTVPHGLRATAWAWALLGGATLLVLAWMLRDLIGFGARGWLAALLRPSILALACAGLAMVGRAVAQRIETTVEVQLAIALAVGTLPFLAIALLAERELVSALLRRSPPARDDEGAG